MPSCGIRHEVKINRALSRVALSSASCPPMKCKADVTLYRSVLTPLSVLRPFKYAAVKLKVECAGLKVSYIAMLFWCARTHTHIHIHIRTYM